MKSISHISELPKNAIYAAKQSDGTWLVWEPEDRATLPASVFPGELPEPVDLDVVAAKQYAKLRALVQMTPAQVQTWVSANVTNLAQAQDAIATLAIAVSVLARRL
jgi:hypothetical protein